MESKGFKKSDNDGCLFTNGTIMLIFWVNNCIVYSKDNAATEKVIGSLKGEFLLKREGSIAGFRGLQVNQNTLNGSITLTQTRLIDRILSAMNMESANHNFTPAPKEPLHKDLNGEPYCEE